MGIKNQFRANLQRDYAQAFVTGDLAHVVEAVRARLPKPTNKCAVDISNVIVAHKIKSGEHEWPASVITFLNTFKSVHYTPVIVFDGKMPEEKRDECAQRSERRAKSQRDLDELSRVVKVLRECALGIGTVRELSGEQAQCVHQALGDGAQHKTPMPIDEHSACALADRLAPVVNKLAGQTIIFNKEDVRRMIDMCVKHKYAYTIAKAEAEQTAALLCATGQVDFVYSEDSDLIAFQCRFLISRQRQLHATDRYSLLLFDKLCAETGLSGAQIRDWAIMCGTDYNKNVKNVSYKRALALLRTSTLEALSTTMDLSVLNFERVRQLFSVDTTQHVEIVG